MNLLAAFTRGITAVNEWVGRWVSYLVWPMFVLMFLEVVFRYGLRRPTVWTNELTQMLFGAYAVLSGGYLIARGGHVNVDILYSRLSRRARALCDVLTSGAFFIFAGTVLYFGATMAYDSLSRLEHSQSAWNPPLYPVKLTIPIGALLLLLQGLAKFLNDLMVLVRGERVEGTAGQALPQGVEDTL